MLDPRPPFDMAQAVFWLVAIVIVVSIFSTATGVGFCIFTAKDGNYDTCTSFKARDFVVELLATAMVLLNSKPPTPPKA